MLKSLTMLNHLQLLVKSCVEKIRPFVQHYTTWTNILILKALVTEQLQHFMEQNPPMKLQYLLLENGLFLLLSKIGEYSGNVFKGKIRSIPKLTVTQIVTKDYEMNPTLSGIHKTQNHKV